MDININTPNKLTVALTGGGTPIPVPVDGDFKIVTLDSTYEEVNEYVEAGKAVVLQVNTTTEYFIPLVGKTKYEQYSESPVCFCFYGWVRPAVLTSSLGTELPSSVMRILTPDGWVRKTMHTSIAKKTDLSKYLPKETYEGFITNSWNPTIQSYDNQIEELRQEIASIDIPVVEERLSTVETRLDDWEEQLRYWEDDVAEIKTEVADRYTKQEVTDLLAGYTTNTSFQSLEGDVALMQIRMDDFTTESDVNSLIDAKLGEIENADY